MNNRLLHLIFGISLKKRETIIKLESNFRGFLPFCIAFSLFSLNELEAQYAYISPIGSSSVICPGDGNVTRYQATGFCTSVECSSNCINWNMDNNFGTLKEISETQIEVTWKLDYLRTYGPTSITANGCGLADDIEITGKAPQANEDLIEVPASVEGDPNGIVNITYADDDPEGNHLTSMSVNLKGGQHVGVCYFSNSNSVSYTGPIGEVEFEIYLNSPCGSLGPFYEICDIKPTCSPYGEVSISEDDPNIIRYDDGYQVEQGKSFTVDVSKVKEFEKHYYWEHNGGDDITFSGNTFTVNANFGSFKIIPKVKIDREGYCPEIESLSIFVGSHDYTFHRVCPIVLPEDLNDPDFGELGYTEGEPALTHFKATVKSNKQIIIKPGIVLESGAELVLEYTPIPDPNDPDKAINYIQSITRNEYGEPISETRQYFDEMGRPTQVQSKDLAKGVVFATETLYDSYGRAVVQTLPAPVSASTLADATDPCGDQIVVGEDMQFKYKENFVTAETGVKYDHTHFDLSVSTEGVITNKEENPQKVASDDEGTLAWYYSSKNGTSTNPLLNEPMTPTTEYPYSRTIFHKDGSGEVKSAAAPGEAYRAGSGNLSTQNTAAVDNNDPYLIDYFKMAAEVTGVPTTDAANYKGNFFKSISWDAEDRMSETYQDLSGNSIMSLYYGKKETEESEPIIKSYQFYDVAGRLKANISPNGVAQYNGLNYSLIDKTTYTYNSKGWLVRTDEPDAGTSEFVYRKDGSIRFSQNAQQIEDNTFSYTHYDRAGRPVASGEYLSNVGGIVFNSQEMKAILESRDSDGGLTEGTGTHRFQTFTGYDSPGEVPGERVQRFIMGNVSWSKNENTTTWYSYDDVGRVEWVVQDITGLGTKTIDYRYGPDGNVREVAYQKGDPTEDFYHYYTYDANGRLNEAFTSITTLEYDIEGKLTNDPADLKLQAAYEYYLHGPLKRVVVADGLQGIDYLYTINGALKAINHADPAKDPGADGIGNDRRKDVFGMTLDYYPEDYKGADYEVGNSVVTSEKALYNGNIKVQSWHVPVDGHEPKAYVYDYDERNQLGNAAFGSLIKTPEADLTYDVALDGNQAFKEAVDAYDNNGNIKELARNAGGLGNPIANYIYDYEPDPEEPDAGFDNKLRNVTHNGEEFLAYKYNAIGQMIRQTTTEGNEVVEMYVDYDLTGKVVAVYRDSGKLKPITRFIYDDRGFRLAKLTFDEEGKNPYTTWYVRDASGTVLSTYFQPAGSTIVDQIEVPIYGSGKIGLYKPMIESTYYEFTDHLGNVRAVIGNKEKVTYMATMETELSKNGGNLLYEYHFEENYFDISRRAPVGDDIHINHTPGIVTLTNPDREFIVDPNQVIRLNNKVENHGGVDGAIMLKVNPGDKISAEVFAKYADFTQGNTDVITGMAGYLAASFLGLPPTGEGSIFDVVDSEIFAALPARKGILDDRPRAFLNILFFNNHFQDDEVRVELDQVSSAAEITGDLTKEHEKLIAEFEVIKGGWVYVYVSNESDQNMEVYFDDLKVTHEYGDIVAGGDYYPFGLAMDTREVTREDYRYGYQGQFAEKDDETGWNHFELRQYDAIIGRFNTVDPAGQFYSSYLAMGNNPVIGIDPTGGTCVTCPDDLIYDRYRNSNLDYAFSKLAGGDGAYQMLPEVVIHSNPTLGNYSMPEWMQKGAEFVMNGSIAIRGGVLSYNDNLIYGTKYDVGSIDLVKVNMGYDSFNEGWYIDPSSGSINFAAQVETPYGDLEGKFVANPWRETTEGGVTGGWTIIRAGMAHDSVHGNHAVLGLSENFAKSIGFGSTNLGIDIGGFIGIRFSK